MPGGSTIRGVVFYNHQAYPNSQGGMKFWLGNSAGDEAYQCGDEITVNQGYKGPYVMLCGGDITGYTWVTAKLTSSSPKLFLAAELFVFAP